MCTRDSLVKWDGAGTGFRVGADVLQARMAATEARYNAILAERAGQSSLRAGSDKAAELRADGRRVEGAQKVAMAANQVSPGESRSALALMSETAYTAEKDAGTVMDTARERADNYGLEADQYRARRKSMQRLAPLAVGAGVLAGGTRAWGRWKQLEG